MEGSNPKADEKKEVKPIPKSEKPLGQIAEEKAEIKQPIQTSSEEIIYRKFDSEDIVRLRSGTIVTHIESEDKNQAKNQAEKTDTDLKERLSIDLGQLQKITICLGVKKCPWFSNMITEEEGVTDAIYFKRMRKEFRKMPVDKIIYLFKEAQEFNKAEFNPGDLTKKL
ncbi:hypothetical protein LCGC14_1165030 [marine sediment metagenome]|uniref:Uncharacterized protein n=1 Tax=marine sediment metagenome TaxID=412755 RepID=A0A0F9LRK8_9ZZZZ